MPLVTVPIIVIAILVFVLLVSGYVKAPPDVAFVISGLHKNPRILVGKAGIKMPFFERCDKLLLRQISVDIKTNGYIPTNDYIGVNIDAIAKVAIDISSPEMCQLAMRNFLNMKEIDIADTLTDSLQGNMREIIGTMDLRSISSDRKKFGDQIQEKAQEDMKNLGIRIISCNIQRVEDENNLINALGQDNMSKIQKDASIAKAEAEKEVAIAKASADQAANDARVAADLEIAKKQNDLAIEKNKLRAIEDIERAKAEAAYSIEQQKQAKTVGYETVEAEIVKTEKTKELKAAEVRVREQELSASIQKQADADKYAKVREAEAILAQQQLEAEGIRAKGEAEAAAIRAKGIAEAEALERKAQAMQMYGKAAMLEMVVSQLPEMAKAIAEPLQQIGKITIFDGGVNSVDSYVPMGLAKTMQTVKEATGIDIADIVRSETYDAKVNRNINVNMNNETEMHELPDEWKFLDKEIAKALEAVRIS